MIFLTLRRFSLNWNWNNSYSVDSNKICKYIFSSIDDFIRKKSLLLQTKLVKGNLFINFKQLVFPVYGFYIYHIYLYHWSLLHRKIKCYSPPTYKNLKNIPDMCCLFLSLCIELRKIIIFVVRPWVLTYLFQY